MSRPVDFPNAPQPPAWQGAADPALDLSVVIVSYNTRAATLQAVGSVLDHAEGLGLEVIVVDNASSDGSAAAVRDAYPGVRVIEAGHNGGYAWGNNLGIAQAGGRHLLVLNPDALMHPGTLRRAVAYLDANPQVGILGARVLLENGAQQSTLFRYTRLSHLFWRMVVPSSVVRKSRLFGDQRYASRDRDALQDVEVVAGCFMMVPRRVIAEAGAMDERFFMYSEESEWCWRIRRAGYAVHYHPDVTITHYGALSTGQVSAWKAVEIAKGQILYLRFTNGPAAAWLGTLLMLGGDVLRAPGALAAAAAGRPAAGGIWRARTGFLLRALCRPPRGQTPPRGPLQSGAVTA